MPQDTDLKKAPLNRFLPSYFISLYLLFMITTCFYLTSIQRWTGATVLLVLASLLIYPAVYLLPSFLLTMLMLLFKRESVRRRAVCIVGCVTAFLTHALLLADAGIFHRYNYHINPHVLNIFTTPGGFAGMGLRTGEYVSMGFSLFLLLALHLVFLFSFSLSAKLCFATAPEMPHTFREIPRKCGKTILTVLLLLLAFLVSLFTYSYNHFKMNPAPLLASDVIPCFVHGTASRLFKAIGVREPDRDAQRVSLKADSRLENYPRQAIVREGQKRYNVVWMACESWSRRLYTPEIMPNTSAFAKKCVDFKYHYSGGNVTRQGVFSMFYGLPGSYWHPFLKALRGPLVIDWMKEDGYTFECFTSSKFSYPEFDQTVFFEVPSANLHSDDVGKTFERDKRNVKRFISAIEDGAKSGKPFFTFMFFESPHNPFEFPPEATLYKDYIDPFEATKVTPADADAIFKRAANCAHHLDICLGMVFDALKANNLLDNTIVVLAGDHGEEYYEKGHLGHSSSFVEEQTRTQLLLYYPGITPYEYTDMSSHLDIVPMLAPLFGVKNRSTDYSTGFDLLHATVNGRPFSRRYALIADWDQVFFVGKKYKSLIPLDTASFAKQVVTDNNDKPLKDVGPFYQEHNDDLRFVQSDLTRFTAPSPKNATSPESKSMVKMVLAILFAIAVFILAGRRVKKSQK